MSDHTPTPWKVTPKHPESPIGYLFEIVMDEPMEDLPWHIASIAGGSSYHSLAAGIEEKANAEFIVRACNAHDKLLEACREALQFFGTLDSTMQIAVSVDIEKDKISGLAVQLKEALASAEKEL